MAVAPQKTFTRKSPSRLTKAELIERNEALERRIHELEQGLAASKSPGKPEIDDGAAQQRLIDATESFTDGFLFFDADDCLVLCNETYRSAMDGMDDVLKPGVAFEDIIRIRAKRKKPRDGEKRDEAWIQERLDQHRNPKGPVLRHFDDGRIVQFQEYKTRDGGTVIIRSDITEQSKALAAIREGEARFHTLINNADQGILVHRHYRALYANQAFADMYGYASPAEILALPSTSVFSAPDSRKQGVFHEARLRGEDVPPNREMKGARKDGTEFWLEKRSFLIDWGGEPAICTIRVDITDRKASEEALQKAYGELERRVDARTRELRESEARLQSIIDNSPNVITMKDLQGRYVVVNKVFAEARKMSVQAIIGKIGGDIDNPETADVVQNHERDVIDKMEDITRERVRITEDGRKKTLSVSKFPVLNADGQLIGVGTTSVDISEAKRAEGILKSAIESIPDGFALYDADDRLVLFNENYVKGRDKLRSILKIGRTFEEITSIRETENMRSSFTAAGKMSIAERVERHRNPTGVYFSTGSDGSVMRIEEIKTPEDYTAIICTDVTDLKKTEAALRESRDELEKRAEDRTRELNSQKVAIDEHAIVSIADVKGNITYANDKFCEISGYSRAELLGQDHRILKSGDHEPEFFTALWRTIANGEVWHGDIKNRAKAGGYYWVRASIVPFLDERGKPFQYVAIRTDITARKIAEEELREAKILADLARAEAETASRAKSEFLSSMSHELRTPMNAILGFAQMLTFDSSEPLSDRQNTCVEHILGGGEHLLELIDQVLELNKIETGNLSLAFEHVSAREVIDKCLPLIGPVAAEKGIEILCPASQNETPLLWADATRLTQVLVNLLSNAVKYNRDGGSVTLSHAKTADGMFRISVADTGHGIAANKQGDVFKPFERLGREAGEIEGTGIGLTITKQIVELMGGTIDFKSEENRGSTFWFDIPLSTDSLGTGQPNS
ncbi:MAG: PAS domain S-box protein [Proteobacteria bacterium]|nr:PAS domain S-box protein [Pseudomonadota bacterium]